MFLGPIHLHMRGILAFTRSNSYITLDILKLRTWSLQSEGCPRNTKVTFENYQSSEFFRFLRSTRFSKRESSFHATYLKTIKLFFLSQWLSEMILFGSFTKKIKIKVVEEPNLVSLYINTLLQMTSPQ